MPASTANLKEFCFNGFCYEGAFCMWPRESEEQKTLDAIADWEYDCERDLAMIEALENP